MSFNISINNSRSPSAADDFAFTFGPLGLAVFEVELLVFVAVLFITIFFIRSASAIFTYETHYTLTELFQNLTYFLSTRNKSTLKMNYLQNNQTNVNNSIFVRQYLLFRQKCVFYR